MLKAIKFAFVGCLVLVVAGSAVAAPVITMSSTLNVVRGANPQQGTAFDVYDFFYSSTAGAQFTNYDITATALTGTLADPVRQQDDRQMDPEALPATALNAGNVDLWVNTVMSSVGKTDGGLNATISQNPAFYQSTGLGAAPPFTQLQWAVLDVELEDDNDLSDHSSGAFAQVAPYHIARILATPGGTGTVAFRAFDTATPNGTNFMFNYGEVVGPPFAVDDLTLTSGRLPGALVTGGPLGTNDDDDPDAGIAWLLESFTGPGGAVVGATVDAASGVFSWQSSASSPLGTYTAVIRGTNDDTPAGSDTGNLSFRLVPEPATFSLFGLAMVGALGFIRRR
jgi:hypothetical protein